MGGNPSPAGVKNSLTVKSVTIPHRVFTEGGQCNPQQWELGKAMYGHGGQMFDVTALVRAKNSGGEILFPVNYAYQHWVDPTPGVAKTLSVTRVTPVAGDFFNEGKTRMGLWDPITGNWHIKGSLGQPDITFQHGITNDIPLGCADIFNEGKYRTITWRPSTGEWTCKGFGQNSWGNSTDNVIFQHGNPGQVPIVANIFGDGNRAIIYDRGTGNWAVKGLGRNGWYESPGNITFQHGIPGDAIETPMVGDLFGDGR